MEFDECKPRQKALTLPVGQAPGRISAVALRNLRVTFIVPLALVVQR